MPYKNKEQQRKAQREWARKHRKPAVVRKRTQNYRIELKRWLLALKTKPCADCGGEFPAVCMDFHHLRDKKFRIAYMVGARYRKESILKEIAKCVLLCSNCHRIRHDKGR